MATLTLLVYHVLLFLLDNGPCRKVLMENDLPKWNLMVFESHQFGSQEPAREGASGRKAATNDNEGEGGAGLGPKGARSLFYLGSAMWWFILCCPILDCTGTNIILSCWFKLFSPHVLYLSISCCALMVSVVRTYGQKKVSSMRSPLVPPFEEILLVKIFQTR